MNVKIRVLGITYVYVYSQNLELNSRCMPLFLNVSLFLNKQTNKLLAALGLRCCTWAFSSCGEWGLFFVVVCRLLIAVASLVAEHGL